MSKKWQENEGDKDKIMRTEDEIRQRLNEFKTIRENGLKMGLELPVGSIALASAISMLEWTLGSEVAGLNHFLATARAGKLV